MMSIIFATLLAYALGLAFAGYVSVLWVIKRNCAGENVFLRWTFIAAHFLLGIGGMLVVPAYLYGRFKYAIDENAAVAFGFSLLLSVFAVLLLARALNSVSK